MIKSISFDKKPSKKKTGGYVKEAGYELDLFAKKTFEFKPGVNILVGKNGCGKTSLLNVLRKLTFCNREMGSSYFFKNYWKLTVGDYIDRQYYNRAHLLADYRICCANVREIAELDSVGELNSAVDFFQKVSGSKKSAGENKLESIFLAMDYLRSNNAYRKEESTQEHLNFKKSCLSHIEQYANYNESFKQVVEYYEKHNLSNQEGYDNSFYGYTIFADEPDSSLDIDNLEQLYQYYAQSPAHYQHIVSMHNIALIAKLAKLPNVNIIEMSKGYMDKVNQFMTGE